MNKKILKKKLLGNGWTALDLVEEEFNVLKILKHPNVIYLHEIINDPNDKNNCEWITPMRQENGEKRVALFSHDESTNKRDEVSKKKCVVWLCGVVKYSTERSLTLWCPCLMPIQ